MAMCVTHPAFSNKEVWTNLQVAFGLHKHAGPLDVGWAGWHWLLEPLHIQLPVHLE